MKKIYTLSALAATAILLSGCAHKCTTLASNQTKAVSFGSGFGDVSARVMQNSVTSGDILQGSIIIENKRNSAQNLQYQVAWYNHAGLPIGQAQPWVPMTISPNLTQAIKVTSVMPNAGAYSVNFCKVD